LDIYNFDFSSNPLKKLDPSAAPWEGAFDFNYSPDGSFILLSGGGTMNGNVLLYELIYGNQIYEFLLRFSYSINSDFDFKNCIIDNMNKFVSVATGNLFMLKVEQYTPIKESDIDFDKINILPNPASDYIEISGSSVILSEAKNLGVFIYDVLGVEVYCSIATPPAPSQEGGKTRLDVSHLSPGVYFLRVGDVVRKFVKM
jgi:hypothetical protein